MWLYHQNTGWLNDPSGQDIWQGYSGQPPHVNVSADEGLEGLGPIPSGTWLVTEVFQEHPKLGPFVLVLEPDEPTRARVILLGRDPDSFRMHGERSIPPSGYASDGCIIMPRSVRELVWDNADHEISVQETI
jgi:hypothetical protein